MATLPVALTEQEREAAIERLRDACTKGELNLTKFSHRLELALLAETPADLARATEGIGAPQDAGVGRQRRPVQRVLALLASTKQRGRWRAANHIAATAFMGEVLLDLRDAELSGDELEVTATAVMGTIKIVVPRMVEVEMDGWAIMGSRDNDVEPGHVQRFLQSFHDDPVRVQTLAQRADLPLLRVVSRIFMGEVKVEYR